MVMFVWLEAPISMKVEWRCASTISGEPCVMTAGAVLMPLWSASSWVMQPPEVSASFIFMCRNDELLFFFFVLQVEFHIAMLSLVLVLDPSTWMMLLVLQVLASCWSALAGQL